MNDIKCAYCGKGGVVIFNEDASAMCTHCLSMSGTCALCEYGILCNFETNPSPLPKQVQKTIRQGNMIMQTVINNPDRIAITCQSGCPCFDPDFGCYKQNGTCSKYAERTPNRPEEKEN